MTMQAQVPPIDQTRGFASAGFWSVGGKLVSRLFDIASLVILTDILAPADFGLVAKAMTVVLIVEMVTLIPVETPILRVKSPDQSLYDTAFTLTLGRACLIGLILVALSWPLSIYFKDPRLAPLMWWLALAPALRGCVSPKLAEFTRRYDMRPEAVMDIVSKFTALVTVTSVALMTRSYWAIAVGTVTTPLVLNALSYIIAPYRPRLSLRYWHEFKDIVTWVTLSQAMQAMNWQLDNFILGRMLGDDKFGRYAIARQLNDIPIQALAWPVSRPMVTSFAAAENDGELRKLWLSYSNGMLFCVGPILVALAMLSTDVVFVLLGPGWHETDLYITGLAIATLPALPLIPLNPLAAATFKTRLVATRVFVQFLISIPAVLIGALSAGVIGAITARGTIELCMLVYIAAVMRNQFGLPIWQQLNSHWRSLAGFALLAVMLWAIRDLGASLTDASRVMTVLRLGVLSLPCFVAYVAFCLLLWFVTGRPDGAESFLFGKIAPKLVRRGRASA
jgi:O-antigen/teichoic acid export membrane protein